MPTQKQGTTLITRFCFHTSTEALATSWTTSKLSLQMKRNIFQYRTGILLNQKHAVHHKMSSSLQCPLSQQACSALHVFSGYQFTIILDMITEYHNVACRLIIKAIRKGFLAGCLVHLDAGSWPNKIFKFLSMLITGQYHWDVPAGSLMLVYLER